MNLLLKIIKYRQKTENRKKTIKELQPQNKQLKEKVRYQSETIRLMKLKMKKNNIKWEEK